MVHASGVAYVFPVLRFAEPVSSEATLEASPLSQLGCSDTTMGVPSG